MFEQTFVSGKTQTVRTTIITFAVQCILIGIAIVIPLIYTEVLPSTQLTSFLVAPPPPPPPPPPAAAAPVEVVKIIPRQFNAGQLMAPKSIPKTIAIIKEEELPPPAAAQVGVVGGLGSSFVSGIIGGAPEVAPPPPVVKETKLAVQRVSVGGKVQAAKLIAQPTPLYPPLARSARIQGTVRFNAVIGTDGKIQNLTFVSGHPLLTPAAQEAVKRWIYQPTLLNGEPVEVVTQIDVNFTLQ
jgi:protein TonB